MARKPAPVGKGIPIGSTHRVDPKTGVLEPVSKKLPPQVAYAKRTKRKWKAAK